MKTLSPGALAISLLVFTPMVGSQENSAQKEKVAEGEYNEWEDGHLIKNTSQTWTIWRTPDGYEVEDRFPPDEAAAQWAVFGAALQRNMSPELREELQNSSTTTDIHVQLAKDGAIRGLLLNGKKLSDASQVQVANCVVKENEISCKGWRGKAHLKNSGQDQLVCSYPFPLLFASMLKQLKPAFNQAVPLKLAMVEELKTKVQITEFSSQLENKGPEKLSIGEYNFNTGKYVLVLPSKSGPRRITLWGSPQGIVFALEDSQLPPGRRVVLTHYKRYSDF